MNYWYAFRTLMAWLIIGSAMLLDDWMLFGLGTILWFGVMAEWIVNAIMQHIEVEVHTYRGEND